MRMIQAGKTPHIESLLNIPLVKRAYNDAGFTFMRRCIDARWTYSTQLPISLSGFAPKLLTYYYGAHSYFERWLENPFDSIRPYNQRDAVVREVLYMAHDYIHSWTYTLINELDPSTGVLDEPRNLGDLERFSFYHLLSEAAATVGLDYWFLAVCDINDYCPVGTLIRQLTTGYSERHATEYAKFISDLNVQSPHFFKQMVDVYLTGQFGTLRPDSIRLSPQLAAWIGHELEYSAGQRSLTRSWLRYRLAAGPAATEELEKPISYVDDQMVQEIGFRLWAMVKEDCGGLIADMLSCRSSSEAAVSKARQTVTADFRFENIAECPTASIVEECRRQKDVSLIYLMYQIVGRTDLDAVPISFKPIIRWLIRQNHAEALLRLLDGFEKITVSPHEPACIFLPN